jgi:hypothetical protein
MQSKLLLCGQHRKFELPPVRPSLTSVMAAALLPSSKSFRSAFKLSIRGFCSKSSAFQQADQQKAVINMEGAKLESTTRPPQVKRNGDNFAYDNGVIDI